MARGFFDAYTSDLKAEDLQRLFTRDARDAYRFFARHIDAAALEGLPWHRRAWVHARMFFLAFTLKLSPARRAIFGIAWVAALVALLQLFNGSATRSAGMADGTGWFLVSFAMLNLLVLLEVADRLSLKNDLEVAREIQEAMLPRGLYSAAGVETLGLSRPANTVGGDFYDILPLEDGRLVIAVGDVAGKGSPAALLMAVLLAMLRTLVRLMEEQKLAPVEVLARLNLQVSRHAPGTRFITLFFGVYQPVTGELQFVNAGHLPPLLLRAGGGRERLTEGGMALGMFDRAAYTSGRVLLGDEDLLAVYSDGITEAESPGGNPFDEAGLEAVLNVESGNTTAAIGDAVLAAVKEHTGESRLADDLTILLLRRTRP
jgi:sigma-B regulation protein RsbU (phosphoserine phosphatase)